MNQCMFHLESESSVRKVVHAVLGRVRVAVRGMVDRKAQIAERYFGVEIAEDGALVVAERQDGRRAGVARYASGAAGVAALRQHIAALPGRPHVCIRACGGAALAAAIGLMSVPLVEVTMIAPRAIESRRAGAEPPSQEPEARAEQLAQRAERLF